MPRTNKSHPRYKDIIIHKEYVHERFWEWGKWAYRLVDGVQQFNHLVAHGLEPHHYLLDMGCGWLRGGINCIEYLDTGRYYGFDKNEAWLEKGKILIKGKNLVHKKPTIKHIYESRNIKYLARGRYGKFDYMMAYSVFTHTDPYMTERLFVHVIPFLKDTGSFLATFHKRGKWGKEYEKPGGKIAIGKCHQYRSDEYRYVKYPFSFFEDLAHENGCGVEELHFDDVHGQDWMCFYRK